MSPIATVGTAFVTLVPKMAKVAAFTSALGLGAVAASAVNLEATFSKTMNTMAAVADVPAGQISKLSDLAIKMGQDTVFSANDAANAMLELAKNGISPATIQSGALKSALTLAAAGGIDMATAATVMGNALNTFGLKGKQAGQVAAALAGGANASSASISSLAQALAQVGPGATNAGLSIQETVAALSAFSNAGIQGSDAGTSLKTMLTRLVPQTIKASNAMKDAGLNFVNTDGSFKSLTNIAGQLQAKLGGLSAEERTRALNTIFGSDATRAASVLMKEGAKGIGKYIKATSDQNAAQRTAAATMKGTAGAIESLKGSVETATLQFGLFIAPTVQAGLLKLTGLVNGIGPAVQRMVTAFKGNAFAMGALDGAISTLKAFGVAIQAVGGFIANNKTAVAGFVGVIGTAIVVMKVWAGITKLLAIYQAILAVGIVTAIGPVILIVGGIALLVAGFILAYKHIKVFHDAVNAVGDLIKAIVMPIVTALGQVFRDQIAPALAVVVAKFKEWMPTILQVAGFVLGLYAKLFQFYFLVASKVLPIVAKFAAFLIVNLAKGIAVAVQLLAKIIGFVIKVGVAFVKAVIQVAKFYIGVVKLIGKVVAFIASLPGKAVNALKSLASKLVGVAVKAFGSMGKSVTSGVGKVIGFVAQLPGKAVTALHSLGSKIAEVARTAFVKMVEKVVTGIGNVKDKFSGIAEKAKNAIGDLSSVLYSKGVDLVQGFINGIAAKIGDLIKKIADLKNLLPGSPVKAGPLMAWNGSSQKAMRRIGGSMVGELAGGLGQTSALDASLLSLTRRINVPRAGQIDLHGNGVAGAAGGTGAMVHIDNVNTYDVNAAARAITNEQRKMLAVAST